MKRERSSRRGRVPLPESERKAKLIQTRVGDELDLVLRDAARQRRITVSHLIRTVLEEAFQLAEAGPDGAHAATHPGHPGHPGAATGAHAGVPASARRDGRRAAPRGKARTNPIEDVDAWQDVTVGRQAACELCLELLNRGDKALIGVSDDPSAPKVWLCTKCAAKL